MAHFSQPAVHDVERTTARVVRLESALCLEIKCRGVNCFGEDAEATVDFFMPPHREGYAKALADAINAVPVPETTSE